MHQRFVKLQKEQKTSFWESSRLEQIKSFRPFDSESSAGFFEPEFMFGVSSFDVVIGNPPYIDSQVMIRTMPGYRESLAPYYQSAKGKWDIYVLFLEKSMELLKTQGVMSMIVKNTLIGSSYATGIRKYLGNFAIDKIEDYSEVNVFKSASVYPIIAQVTKVNIKKPVEIAIYNTLDNLSLERSIPAGDFYNENNWGIFFSSQSTRDFFTSFPKSIELNKLNFISEVSSSGFTNEAYQLKEFIQEYSRKFETKKHRKFMTTGLIDPFMSLWGVSKCRYLKVDFSLPIVLDEDIAKVNSRRLIVAKLPKIIVGGMSKKIEAYLDSDGSYMPGVSTFYVSIEEESSLPQLKYLLGLLNSDLISAWFSENFRGLRMAGGYLRISHNELGKIPVVLGSKSQQIKLLKIVDQLVDSPASEEERIALISDLNETVLEIYGISSEQWAEVQSSLSS